MAIPPIQGQSALSLVLLAGSLLTAWDEQGWSVDGSYAISPSPWGSDSFSPTGGGASCAILLLLLLA
jgi:hypothetical protein